jgi:hypothetical protein
MSKKSLKTLAVAALALALAVPVRASEDGSHGKPWPLSWVEIFAWVTPGWARTPSVPGVGNREKCGGMVDPLGHCSPSPTQSSQDGGAGECGGMVDPLGHCLG